MTPGTIPGRVGGLLRAAGWLWKRARELDGLPGQSTHCACGAALAHVAALGVRAVLCPECDRDALREHTDQAEPETGGPTPEQGSLLPALELSVRRRGNPAPRRSRPQAHDVIDLYGGCGARGAAGAR